MEIQGEYRIEAPREKVWKALNDPNVLRQAIPGCEELEQTSDDEFSAKVKAKVGPVNAKFGGKVQLSDINPPESYTISGEGSGGAAGFAKGSAKVRLADDGGATVLTYDANAQVGGKLAQIGSRLIQGTARKMADQFFGKFAEIVGAPVEKPAEGKIAEPTPTPEAIPTPEEEQRIAEETSKAAERGAALGHTMPEGPTGGEGPPQTDKKQASASADRQGSSAVVQRIPMAIWIAGLIGIVLVLLLIFG
jgi:hypothetical protein